MAIYDASQCVNGNWDNNGHSYYDYGSYNGHWLFTITNPTGQPAQINSITINLGTGSGEFANGGVGYGNPLSVSLLANDSVWSNSVTVGNAVSATSSKWPHYPELAGWSYTFTFSTPVSLPDYNSTASFNAYWDRDILVWSGLVDNYYCGYFAADISEATVDITYHSNYTPGVADHVQSVTKNVSTPVWNGSGWTRTGYELTGWNTANDGSGTPYSTSSSITASADMDLYAIWSPQVTFDANILNPSGSTSPVYINYYTGSTLTLNGFSKTNLEFFRWATSSLGTGTVYSDGERVVAVSDGGVHKVIDVPTTLYATWRARITYHANYSGSSATQEQTVYGRSSSSSDFVGNAVTIIANPTFSRQGYHVVKWATQSDGSGTSYIPGQQYSAGTINSSIDLYAIWAPNRNNWYWYNQTDDPTYIKSGEPTTNALASRFNDGTEPDLGLQGEIKKYINPSYVSITKSSGSAMTASDFNHAYNAITGSNHSNVVAGSVIYASQFIDIRNELNNNANN